jgi:activating signal cointegrator complex subunit 1
MNETVSEEEVISYEQNNICFFKIDFITNRKLIEFKSLKKLSKSLNTFIILGNVESNDNIDKNDVLVTINGENRDKVIETKTKMNKMVVSMRQKLSFTHLITVPFNNDIMRQQFCQFKDQILTEFKDCKGIDESLFQNPSKLHLTFCVLVLLNQNEVLKAKQILNNSLHQIVKPLLNDKPLNVSVNGLDVMNNNPKRAHILFGQIVDPSNYFQEIADRIVGQFKESGFLRDSHSEERVKLHVTFMNSLFRQRIISRTNESQNKKFKSIKREPFDASGIVDKYKSHKFSDFIIENIQFNDIKTKNEDGFYGRIEMIELPKE